MGEEGKSIFLVLYMKKQNSSVSFSQFLSLRSVRHPSLCLSFSDAGIFFNVFLSFLIPNILLTKTLSFFTQFTMFIYSHAFERQNCIKTFDFHGFLHFLNYNSVNCSIFVISFSYTIFFNQFRFVRLTWCPNPSIFFNFLQLIRVVADSMYP